MQWNEEPEVAPWIPQRQDLECCKDEHSLPESKESTKTKKKPWRGCNLTLAEPRESNDQDCEMEIYFKRSSRRQSNQVRFMVWTHLLKIAATLSDVRSTYEARKLGSETSKPDLCDSFQNSMMVLNRLPEDRIDQGLEDQSKWNNRTRWIPKKIILV